MTVRVNADVSGALAAAGFIKGVAAEIDTDKHINAVMDLLFTDLSVEFLEYMDTYAESAPEKFHHVYEWDMIGLAKGRLFTPVMLGRGRNRTISWKWRASKKIVPLSPEAEEAGVKKIHVFVWKAPFMEYNTDGVTIEPKRHEWISAFTRDSYHGLRAIKGPVHVANPGGPEVRGAFSEAFAQWWARGQAHAAYVNRRAVLEHNLATMPIAKTARKSKGFSLSVGEADGRNFIRRLTGNYIAQAAQRLEFMGGEE